MARSLAARLGIGGQLVEELGIDELLSREDLTTEVLANTFGLPEDWLRQLARRCGRRPRSRLRDWWTGCSASARVGFLRRCVAAWLRRVPAYLRVPLLGFRLADQGRERGFRAGVKPRSIGDGRLAPWERRSLERLEARLRAEGAYDSKPKVVPRDCPPEALPCPWVSCRYHLAIDVIPLKTPGLPPVIKINHPGRDVGQLEECCSLRAAKKARRHNVEGGLTLERVGVLMNLTMGRTDQIEKRAARKVRLTLLEE